MNPYFSLGKGIQNLFLSLTNFLPSRVKKAVWLEQLLILNGRFQSNEIRVMFEADRLSNHTVLT
jgi:hypothetical protein